jgi:hypothetical protein
MDLTKLSDLLFKLILYTMILCFVYYILVNKIIIVNVNIQQY